MTLIDKIKNELKDFHIWANDPVRDEEMICVINSFAKEIKKHAVEEITLMASSTVEEQDRMKDKLKKGLG